MTTEHEQIKYAISAYIEDLENHRLAHQFAIWRHDVLGEPVNDIEYHREGYDNAVYAIREYKDLLVRWEVEGW